MFEVLFMKIKLVLVFLFCIAWELFAQQASSITQYFQQPYIFNPAAAGVNGFASIDFLAREQWLGFEGAPNTHFFSAQMRGTPNFSGKKRRTVNSRSNTGLGAMVYNDRYSLFNYTGAQISYAYHILSRASQWSFGLGLNGSQFKLDKNNAKTKFDDPLLFNNTSGSLFIPDANAGFWFVSASYYGGASVSNIFQSAIKSGDPSFQNYQLNRNYYLTAGYYLYFASLLQLTPSFLVQNSAGNTSVDITMKGTYDNKFSAGLSFRTSGEVAFFAGLNVKAINLGYAFELPVGAIRPHAFGTHELFFSYALSGNKRKEKLF